METDFSSLIQRVNTYAIITGIKIKKVNNLHIHICYVSHILQIVGIFFSTFDIFKNILIYFHFFLETIFFFHDSFIPLFDRLILYLIYLFSHCYFTHSFNLDFFLFFLHVFSPTRFLFTCRTCSIIYDI